MRVSRVRKLQRGAISLLAAGTIALSLTTFNQVLEYTNAKILDRELDNYARDIAAVALRSELAITKNMPNKAITSTTVDNILAGVGQFTSSDETKGQIQNLTATITFGNFDKDGNFKALESNMHNPRAADVEMPLEFSAVAVQLSAKEKFMGVFRPEGKALYGMSLESTEADSGCYCKNRYSACLDMEFTATDLASLSDAQASAVLVKGSDARKNYCRYGSTKEKPGSPSTTKYPWSPFDDGWIGRVPKTVKVFRFYTEGYDDAVFSKILEQKPLVITDGNDPLYETGGFMTSFKEVMSKMPFMGMFTSVDYKYAYIDDSSGGFMKGGNYLTKRDISSSIQGDYRCEKGLFRSAIVGCNDGGFMTNSRKSVLNDSFYIGYQGTCVANTTPENIALGRCLGYSETTSKGLGKNKVTTTNEYFESCLEIERRSTISMNFFERMMAFFLGPILNWERAYEGLDCEMKKMHYKGWLFWGGWKES